MRINVNVLLGILLCVLLVVIGGTMYRMSEEEDTWRPNDIYTRVGDVSSADAPTYSHAHSSDEVAVALRELSRPSRRRVKMPVFSNAHSTIGVGVNAGSNLPSLQGGAGVGLYTTSSHMTKSFGSGLAAGVSTQMQTTRSAEQVAASSLSVPALSSYSMPNRSLLPSADQAIAAASYTPMVSAVSAVGADAVPVYRGISGRKNAAPSGGGYTNWLNGTYIYTDDEGNLYYNMSDLEEAYKQAISNGNLPPYMTWEDFLAMFFGDGTGKYRVPLGEAWVLLVMALGYALVMWIKSRRVAAKKVLND